MGRKTLKQRQERDAARIAEQTIGGRIIERARQASSTDADWYANELYTELSEVSETRFPEIG